jgi:hypothetical protein
VVGYVQSWSVCCGTYDAVAGILEGVADGGWWWWALADERCPIVLAGTLYVQSQRKGSGTLCHLYTEGERASSGEASFLLYGKSKQIKPASSILLWNGQKGVCLWYSGLLIESEPSLAQIG